MSVNKLTGIPWHIEKMHRQDGDERRHRSRCVYYEKENQFCKKRMLKCKGSAHCDKYQEEKTAVGKITKRAKWKYTTKLIAINKKSYRNNICIFCNTNSLILTPLHCVIFGNEEKTEFVGTVEDAYCKCCKTCGKQFTTVETLNYFTGGISLKRTNLKVDFINQEEING